MKYSSAHAEPTIPPTSVTHRQRLRFAFINPSRFAGMRLDRANRPPGRVCADRTTTPKRTLFLCCLNRPDTCYACGKWNVKRLTGVSIGFVMRAAAEE